MLVNANFSILVIVTPAAYEWVASPQEGVERVMLDRIGEECVANAVAGLACQLAMIR